ncbi:hypothetical protein R3P38DRAFT_3259130 [Favolaschia claudopus]|uniref:Shugoshin C-terminal domain-containing protein n=1 Tax=Favolaschia claudopus TaxID=2862362 RepID=A0AAW0D355_9AGAR
MPPASNSVSQANYDLYAMSADTIHQAAVQNVASTSVTSALETRYTDLEAELRTLKQRSVWQDAELARQDEEITQLGAQRDLDRIRLAEMTARLEKLEEQTRSTHSSNGSRLRALRKREASQSFEDMDRMEGGKRKLPGATRPPIPMKRQRLSPGPAPARRRSSLSIKPVPLPHSKRLIPAEPVFDSSDDEPEDNQLQTYASDPDDPTRLIRLARPRYSLFGRNRAACKKGGDAVVGLVSPEV